MSKVTEAMVEAGRKAIMGMLKPKRTPLPKPTIAELEAILNAEDTRSISIAQDGSFFVLEPRTTNATEIARAVLQAALDSQSSASPEGGDNNSAVPYEQLRDGAYYWWKGGPNYPWQPVCVRPTERIKITGVHYNGWDCPLFGTFVGPLFRPMNEPQTPPQGE